MSLNIAKQFLIQSMQIESYSFGSLFIRPIISLSSSAVSICLYIKYKFKSGRSEKWNPLKN